jgi:hypothetical protein
MINTGEAHCQTVRLAVATQEKPMLQQDWRIDVFDDRNSTDATHSEPLTGAEEAAANRACELLDRLGGMKADITPM